MQKEKVNNFHLSVAFIYVILRFFPTHSSRHSSNLPAARNVYAKQIVLVAQPCLARTLRVYLFAMSATLDVRKCFALASLFFHGLR